MKICIISNKYPNKHDQNILVFVQRFAWSLAEYGVDCAVISPIPINLNPRYIDIPAYYQETTTFGAKVDVYRPKCLGFGQSKTVMGKSPIQATTRFMEMAVCKVIERNHLDFDAFVGHFSAPAGVVAARVGKRFNVASFVAFGDSSMAFVDRFGREKIREEFRDLSGIIAVSTAGKNSLVKAHILDDERIHVIPNAFNPNRFYPRNKVESRKQLGLPLDAFIVGYVGWFNERKGIKRLEAAVDSASGVYFIAAGKGPLKPVSKKCLLARSIGNGELPIFYSALDAFVLPTLNEGCCNAIIEAIACGIPVVSSDLEFNYDLLDSECSILVDPCDPAQITKAIMTLKDNSSLRAKLAKGSLEKAKMLTSDIRLAKILKLINK